MVGSPRSNSVSHKKKGSTEQTSTTHQLLEIGCERKVQDEFRVVECPELFDDGRSHAVSMDGREEVTKETSHVIIELCTRA